MVRKSSKFDTEKKDIVIVPMNDHQKEYINALRTSPQTIVLGPAGTGKTYIAASFAASLYNTKRISKIILTRPNVSSGRSLGFFPGTLEEKMAPWCVPVMEILVKHLGSGVVETGLKNGNIEIAPFETMRGRSFEDAFVLLDEAQNTTYHEMKMFLTRTGENCRVVIDGDIQQSDLKSTSGLASIIDIARKNEMKLPVIEFTVDDIVRSDICRDWIIAFLKEEQQ